MKIIVKKRERILYIETKEIRLLDIPRALDENGYEVYKASFGFSAQGYDKESFQMVKHAIEEYEIQYVISYDFSESIAQACYETGVPYIAWVYDAPQKELYTQYALYPSNYIFVFDKMQQKRLQEIGITNVYHMPLAILGNRVKLNLYEKEKRQDLTEITFVGQLYKIENTNIILENADEDIRTGIEENVQECFLQWNDDICLHGKMKDNCVQFFNTVDQGKVSNNYPYMSEQFYYEAAVTSRLLANRERVTILNTLAEKYDVRFYTNDKDTSQLSSKVNVLPGLKYDELSKVYRDSKININITLHCIETGACQRIFDVMAAGGFMLSNYQKELEELFVVGEEIVLYHNLKELEELVEYYLTHEEERKQIAINGQKKVLRLHDFHGKMERVMNIMAGREKERKLPYLILDRELLIRQADRLLVNATDQAYCELAILLRKKRYQTVVQKTSELGTLLEMVNCRNTELQTGKSNIFCGVKSVNQAEQKYLGIKYILWRLESGICEDKCREDIYNLCIKKESKFLITWIAKANLQKWEEVIVAVSQYMQEYNYTDAIELLSYGILLAPGNTDMLMQKANCFMELGMWKEMLETLTMVEEPNEEIQSLILELTMALKGAENE